jgi:HAD superfamily hydrolase (TIGR01450 family)
MKYLIDIDGTLLVENKANRGAIAFIDELQNRSIEYLLMTNSIRSPRSIAERLSLAGINVTENRILNPINAVNVYLETNNYVKAYIVGSVSEIEQIKIGNTQNNPEILVLLDFEKNNVNYNELQTIYSFIQKGIPVIAASGSPYYLKEGIRYLDTGSFVNMIKNTANVEIKILGKPSAEYFNAGISLLHAKTQDITVIGDDWSTDIVGATDAGCNSVLIKTGKYQSGDESKCNPKKIIYDLMEVL